MGPVGFLPCALRSEHLALGPGHGAARSEHLPRSARLFVRGVEPLALRTQIKARSPSHEALSSKSVALSTPGQGQGLLRPSLFARSTTGLALGSSLSVPSTTGAVLGAQPWGLRSLRYAQLVRGVYLMRGVAREGPPRAAHSRSPPYASLSPIFASFTSTLAPHFKWVLVFLHAATPAA
jgi:hypothetical protein